MKKIEMISVVSSNIHSIGYNNQELTLYVSFHRGGIYAYYGVNANTFNALLNAPSKGSYFSRYVKNGYHCAKVG